MAKVALYLRVSTPEQELENQLQVLQDWAIREGHTIYKVYQDVMSGARPREDFDNLMADAHKHRFDMVAFWKLDRMTREGVLATLLYLDTLNKLGISVYSHQESWLNPKMPFYGVVVAALAEFARMERENISERTKMGLGNVHNDEGVRVSRKTGKPIGRPPGKRDSRPRQKIGYFLREAKKRGEI